MGRLFPKSNLKAGKSFLEFAKNLPFVKINEDLRLEKKVELTAKEQKYLKNLKKVSSEVDSGKYNSQSLNSFLDEL